MRLTAKIVNSDATLNSWKEIGSLDFQPGESLTLKMRLFDNAENLRYIPPAATIMKVFFNTTESSLEKTATLDSSDRSFATINLSVAESEDLVGGNITFTLDEARDGTIIRKGVIRNALSKVVTDC